MRKYFQILAFGSQYRKNGMMAGLLLVLHNFFGLVSLALIIPFLQILFNEEAPRQPATPPDIGNLKDWLFYQLGAFVQHAGPDGKLRVLMIACLILVLCILLKNAFKYFAAWNIGPLEQGVVKGMRDRLFSHLSRLSMEFFTGKKKGEIINVMITDVQVIQESVIGTLFNVINDPLTMLFILGGMLFLSWKLTAFTLLILPASGILISRISKGLKRKAREGQESLGALVGVIDEFTGGIRIVKSFGAEQHEKDKYHRQNEAYFRQMVSLKRRSDLSSPLTEVLSVIVVAGVILYGGSLILGGSAELKPSEFIGFVALFSQFLAPIKTLSAAASRIQRGVASFNRVEEFLALEESVKEDPHPLPLKHLERAIEFRQVDFSYKEKQVLKQISFIIRKGERIAIVGPSGGGKSTLADLLPRFYDPARGGIFIDGTDIRKASVKDLRNLFGIVSQEGILFHDTVLNNIAYGDAHPDREKAQQAARAAHAHEFISQLPEGYDTRIGERGTQLSGGQRQRLSIARALYRDPEVLILDEATSALDTESEKLVQAALDQLMQGRTSLVIAHRLSTITHADRIIVVDAGEIVQIGTHENLLQSEGIYKRLYLKQFDGQ